MKKLFGIVFLIILITNSNAAFSIVTEPSFLLEVKPGCIFNFLSWQKVFGATKYEIYRGIEELKPTKIFELYENFFRDTDNLKESINYCYQIVAKNDKENILAKSNFSCSQPVCADPNRCVINLSYQVGSYMYWVDGRQEGPMEAAPEMNGGRLFLVIRYITKEVGSSINWDKNDRRVTITTYEGNVIELWIDNPKAKINGIEEPIDPKNEQVKPYVKNGRTMLPMRFVSEKMGVIGTDGILWEKETQTAKLKLKRPGCYDFDCLTLKITKLDPEGKTIECIDQIGAFFTVIVPENQYEEVKTFQSGGFISSCGQIGIRSDHNTTLFNARSVTRISLESSSKIRGIIKKIDKKEGILVLKDCQENEHSYPIEGVYLPSSVEVEMPVILTVRAGKIIVCEIVSLDETCPGKDDSMTFEVKLVKVECEERYIITTKADNPKEQIIIYFKHEEYDLWCSLKPDSCYQIVCIYDTFGRIVGRTATLIECPCSYLLEPGASSINGVLGSKLIYKYKTKNTDSLKQIFTPILTITNLKGTAVVSPDSIEVEPEGVAEFKIELRLDDTFIGKSELTYGVKCKNGSQRTEILNVESSPPTFEVNITRGSLKWPIDEEGKIYYEIKNTSPSEIIVKSYLKGDFPGEISVKPETRTIGSGSRSEFTVTALWKMSVAPGVKVKIEIGAVVGFVQETKAIELEAMPVTGPTITLNDQRTDEFGYIELQGSVNWKRYPPGKITFEWGDNEATVDKFPAKHTFERAGEYNVKVTAKAETGESGSSTCIVTFSGVIPEINITRAVYRVDLRRAELDGLVIWHGLEPGDITVDWDDGTKDTKTRFPFEHVYDRNEIRFTIITAKAKTGEKGIILALIIPTPKPHEEIIGFSLRCKYTYEHLPWSPYRTYSQQQPDNRNPTPFLWRRPPLYSDAL